MAEIRFPRRGREQRRGVHESNPADPLEEMAAQIRQLDAAADAVASRIAEAASRLRENESADRSATRADLLAGLAAALVGRTEEIQADCGRLSVLMDRTAQLIAERDDAATVAPPPAPPSGPPPGVAVPRGGAPAPRVDDQPQATLPEPAFDQPGSADDDLVESVRERSRPAWFSRPEEDPDPSPPDQAGEGEPPDAYEEEAELPVSDDQVAYEGSDSPASEGESPAPTNFEDEPDPAPRSTSEGVRLIATQMAIAGSSRVEIERRLRIQFGVRDAGQALDEIFSGRRSEVR